MDTLQVSDLILLDAVMPKHNIRRSKTRIYWVRGNRMPRQKGR